MESLKIVADGFTKELPRQKFEEFVRQLNLRDITNMVLEVESHETHQQSTESVNLSVLTAD